ncbi:Platelet-activating factor acetylhydrolase, isoform II [Alkalispirochaeta americana]|uniref:Platelet-activating factor acetylhydrolase, isoform II n=1 Tax=Alkalispirochaeta americana TaxID=159291 RepID=A0A1N6SZK3_9SPIO|nr:hypothetical protein [Alkalispirochaeta americana]SIQ46502.1 Platelet-activating factor acetylhydrolase, isoform II [Alkalispirochaeta americana]
MAWFVKCITLRVWVSLVILCVVALLAFLVAMLLFRHVGREIPGSQERMEAVPIDTVRSDAPELARLQRGFVGVRTLEFSNPDQLDVEEVSRGNIGERSDRILPVEIWYPAARREGNTVYEVTGRDGDPLLLRGAAHRDAPADYSRGPFPLVILSHGYPGNRFLMSHFGEFLAGLGYVVVSIDHKDSTYTDQGAFAGTLRNRALDQVFVLQETARLSKEGSGSFLERLADPDRTGLIGYSMGGYGALNALGAGLSDRVLDADFSLPGVLDERLASHPEYAQTIDPRIRAAVVIAPWGAQAGLWDAPSFEKISVPLFFMAGTSDSVSGYQEGPRAAFLKTRATSRYLLSYELAGHAVAAPIPVPAWVWAGRTGFGHYADPVWDTVTMNNIAQHFVAAFFGQELKGDASMTRFLREQPGDDDQVASFPEVPRGTRLEFLQSGE